MNSMQYHIVTLLFQNVGFKDTKMAMEELIRKKEIKDSYFSTLKTGEFNLHQVPI